MMIAETFYFREFSVMYKPVIPLSSLDIGQEGIVTYFDKNCQLLSRLLDLGLTEGTRVCCLLKSPSGDPKAYFIRGALIALRCEDASLVFVKPLGEVEK